MTDGLKQQRIVAPSSLRKWRTEIPNLYDDARLDPYEFRLLVHYIRVGFCWESLRTTAEKCVMSPAEVLKKRKSLAQKGFVVLSQNDYGTTTITIIDRWQENFDKYSHRERSPQEQDDPECSPDEHAFTTQTACLPGERKKEPIKKEEDPINGVPLIGGVPPPPVETSKPKPSKKPADPRTYSPAITACSSVRGKNPPKTLYDKIIAALGEHPDEKRLRECCEEWDARGYNQNSWKWVLDWYVNGIAGGTSRPQNRGPSPPSPPSRPLTGGSWRSPLTGEEHYEGKPKHQDTS